MVKRKEIAMHETDAQLAAYNAAFDKLGLDWHWDDDDSRALAGIADERERIGAYIRRRRPHLLKCYDVGFLCELIHSTKARHEASVARRTSTPPRRVAG